MFRPPKIWEFGENLERGETSPRAPAAKQLIIGQRKLWVNGLWLYYIYSVLWQQTLHLTRLGYAKITALYGVGVWGVEV